MMFFLDGNFPRPALAHLQATGHKAIPERRPGRALQLRR